MTWSRDDTTGSSRGAAESHCRRLHCDALADRRLGEAALEGLLERLLLLLAGHGLIEADRRLTAVKADRRHLVVEVRALGEAPAHAGGRSAGEAGETAGDGGEGGGESALHDLALF